jgi:myo-inositol 2-dehydrogenase/D-chiro-inositol 1-dehydrogenase
MEVGNHLFTEKPVAMDPADVCSVIESSKLPEKKKPSVLAGTQRQHQSHCFEITKRMYNGQDWRNQSGPVFLGHGLNASVARLTVCS